MLHIHVLAVFITVLTLIGLLIWGFKHMDKKELKKILLKGFLISAIVMLLTASFGLSVMKGFMEKHDKSMMKGQIQMQNPFMMDGMMDDDWK